MVAVPVHIRTVSQSLHQVRGPGWVLCFSLFIGGAIVHICNGDESGVLRNWVALSRSRVLKPNLTVITATCRRRITRLACCITRVLSFCFLSRCVAMFCFHFASTDLAARCLWAAFLNPVSFFSTLFNPCCAVLARLLKTVTL
jgi:hypothetical protein